MFTKCATSGWIIFLKCYFFNKIVINTRTKDAIGMVSSTDIFPEYYIIRVNEFNKVATTPLEEWLDYLKDGNIRDNTTTPGLAEARERLRYMQMSDDERRAYDRHNDNIMVQNDILETKMIEGREQGLEEGRARGLEQGLEQVLFNNVRKLVANLGMSVSEAFDVLEVSEEDRERFLAMETCDTRGL